MTGFEEDVIGSIVRGLSRAIILWLISRESLSGYRILKRMKEMTGRKLHSGIIYPLLYELEDKNLIRGRWIRRGRRWIKYYSITDKGVNMLDHLRKFFERPIRNPLISFIGEDEENIE